MTEVSSPNFAFFTNLDPPLMHQAAQAERYCHADPSSSLTKLRYFGEFLAKNIAARFGINTDYKSKEIDIIREFNYRETLGQKHADMLNIIRIAGNAAVSGGKDTVPETLEVLITV